MASTILFILAIITLVITFCNFLKRLPSRDSRRSEYREAKTDKQRVKVKPHENIWFSFFQSPFERRRDYYRNNYLKSEAWKRKRYVVLRRDNWSCVYCGDRATQVHHKKYAKRNIGKEPIEWLVSVCKPCHDAQHT